MFDSGLLGGWAAGGPAAPAAATNAQTPAGAAASAHADATTLADAFGDLMQALATAPAAATAPADVAVLASSVPEQFVPAADARNIADGALLNMLGEPVAFERPRSFRERGLDADQRNDHKHDKDNQDRGVIVASWWPAEPIPAPVPAPRILAFTGARVEEAPAPTSSTPAQLTTPPIEGTEVAELAPASERTEPAPLSRPVDVIQPATKRAATRISARIDDSPEAPRSIESLQRFMVARGKATSESAEPIESGRAAELPAAKPFVPAAQQPAPSRLEFTGSSGQGAAHEQPPRPKFVLPTLMMAPVPYVPVSSASRLPAVAEVSAPATAPETPDTTGVAPQIVSALRLAWSRGSGEAHIRLDPAQFGDVSVLIRVEAGQVVARIQAESPAIREWLQTNHRSLQESLAQHDLKLARLDVTAPSDEARDASRRDDRDRRQDADAPPVRRMKRPDTGATFDFETVA